MSPLKIQVSELRPLGPLYYSPTRAGESICTWFCWRTWRWDQFVFYIRYLMRL